MNNFYRIAKENETPEHEFILANLGLKIKHTQLVNYGFGRLGSELIYKETKSEDYDKSFVSLLTNMEPIYKANELLNFHFSHFNGNKKEFLAHIRYNILPLMKKNQKSNEGYSQLVADWLDSKDIKPHSVTNITIGEIKAPTQLQVNSDYSNQSQNISYSKDSIKELFELLKKDIERLELAPEIKNEFFQKWSMLHYK